MYAQVHVCTRFMLLLVRSQPGKNMKKHQFIQLAKTTTDFAKQQTCFEMHFPCSFTSLYFLARPKCVVPEDSVNSRNLKKN